MRAKHLKRVESTQVSEMILCLVPRWTHRWMDGIKIGYRTKNDLNSLIIDFLWQ